jgi:ribosome biogenesis GTPase
MSSKINKGTNSKRNQRQQRPDAYKEWQEGRLEGHEISGERRSREGSRSKGKRKTVATNSSLETEPFQNALLIEQHRRTCEVLLDSGENATVKYHPQLNLQAFGMLAVGDRLELVKEPLSGDIYLADVVERQSKLSRPGPPDREHREQILAANIDQVVVVVSLHQPDFNAGFVDRYMMVCEASNIPMVMVLNKMDLAVDDLPDRITQFKPFLSNLILTSAKTGAGLDELTKLLEGKKSVMTGQSGVGKSSLLNALFPDLDIKTGDVREGDGKGRHTTTHSTLFAVEEGWVIDTPGIRRLGFWKMEQAELALVFPFFKNIPPCKFNDCLHLTEPGCKVLEALDEEELDDYMYDSYLRISETI